MIITVVTQLACKRDSKSINVLRLLDIEIFWVNDGYFPVSKTSTLSNYAELLATLWEYITANITRHGITYQQLESSSRELTNDPLRHPARPLPLRLYPVKSRSQSSSLATLTLAYSRSARSLPT